MAGKVLIRFDAKFEADLEHTCFHTALQTI